MNDMAMQTQQINLQSSKSTQSTSPDQSSDLSSTENGELAVQFSELLTSAIENNGELVLTEQLKKSAEILGTQINAQMLAVNPLLAAMLINQLSQAAQGNQAAAQQSSALESMATTQAASTVTGTQLTPEIISQLEAAMVAASESSETTTAFPILAEVADSSQPLAVVDSKAEVYAAKTLPTEEVLTNSLQAQTQFVRAVEQAQQMLLKSTDSTNALASSTLDIDELQKKVDSGEFLTQAAVSTQQYTAESSAVKDLPATSESGEPLDAQDIFSQIKSETASHTQSGSDDFVIKLSPEGLGKITVRLLEEGGKITMSIAASDTNVQRLLSSELTNLRDVMRPYNVEVTQVTQSNEAQTMDLKQQFSQNNFTRQQQSSSAPYSNYSESNETDEQVQTTVESNSILDAYV